MKKINILMLFVGLLVSVALKAQTKEETIKWIRGQTEHSAMHTGFLGTEVRFITIYNNGGFKVKSKTYTSPLPMPGEEPKYATYLTGNFKDLDPNSVKVVVHNGVGILSASCSNGNKCVIQDDMEGSIQNMPNGSVALAYIDTDPTYQARMIKAFKHLIRLCGGKADTF